MPTILPTYRRPSASSILLALWILMLLLVSTALPAETGPVDAKTGIEAADRQFNQAARERDREAFRAQLAEDAIFLAGELHRGRLEVLTIWQHLFDGKYDFRYEAETLEVHAAESGEFGYTIGTARTRFKRPGLDTEEGVDGHYLNVWRRAEDSWELAYSSSLVVHPTLGAARDPRSGLMTAWPQLADQIDAEIDLHWTPETTVRAPSGELAYSFGAYSARFAQPGADEPSDTPTGASDGPESEEAKPISGRGHYLAVWQKDGKGRWQLAAEGFTPPGIFE